jgi:uncharacterized protein YcaQ
MPLPALQELEDAGTLLPVTVAAGERGRPARAWVHREARFPRRIETTALLSPFDPVVWERARAERMFGFHYRIEIYTPQPKRVFGYYVLPLLVDDQLVGRVDLKSDRQNGVLRVQASWTEPVRLWTLQPDWRHCCARLPPGRVSTIGRGHGGRGPRLADAVAAELGQRAVQPD